METSNATRGSGAVQVGAMDNALAVTVNEAVRRTGIPRTNVYQFMGDGSLPYYHVGRHRLILVRDLHAFIVARPGAARKQAKRTEAA